MAAITNTDANIRPLEGAITRRGTAGGSMNVGDAVYLDGANGWKQADADAEASAQARGVVVAGPQGATAIVSGDRIDICVYGPVEGFASMTPGAVIYNSVTAGALDQTASVIAGDYPFVVGYAESASVVFVDPQVIVPTAVPS